MAGKKKKQRALGPLQQAVMESLWVREQATVSDIHGDLQPSTGTALTTVATVLRRMEIQGLVSHTVDGRQFVYRPLVTRSELAESAADDLLDRLFSGSLAGMVSHVFRRRKVSARELDELEAMIAAHRRGERKDPP